MRLERWIYTVPLRLRSLFRGERVDRELDEELQFHVQRLTDEHIARGASPAEARLAALRAMNGVEQRKEECRDTRRVRLVQDVLQDLRYAGRTLLRSRGFTAAAIVTLALGIGASVAAFTVVNGVLLRPMPFPESDRLFLLSHTEIGPFMSQPGLADSQYLEFRASDRLFAHLAAFTIAYGASLTAPGDPSIVRASRVTTEFFAALRVAPAIGRTFGAGDDQPGRDHIVLLSDALWRSRFGADPVVSGREITLDGVRHTVVGVMPPGFDFPGEAAIWTPMAIRSDRGNSLLYPVLGRLKPGVSVAQAQAEFDTIVRQAAKPETDARWISGVIPVKELMVRDIRRPLEIFAGAVGFVLLIACANVANLLLARATSRQREIAIRAALGASRARLVRQLLTESVLVSFAGGLCGILLARWGVPALLALAPKGRIPRTDLIHVDGQVLGFALVVSLLTGIVFGLAPALRMTRGRFSGSLLPGGRASVAGQDRLRAALVVGEIALALVLLTGAGLMLKSFLRLRAVDTGFRPENVLTLTVDLPRAVYPTAQKLQAFHQETLLRLSTLPGVLGVGAVNFRPLGTMLISGDFQIEDGPPIVGDIRADKPAVSAGYFSAMGIRLVRGRDFTERDDAKGAGVAIVSRTVARMISPSEDAVGRRITLESNPKPEDWVTIVGVVDDVKQWGPSQPAHMAIYRPFLQVTRPFFLSHMTFAVRTPSDPLALAPALRSVLRSVDRNQPAQSIASMADVMAAATADPAFQARLLGGFAVLALLLALVGTYGVLAYSVAQQTHEIGLRMALGARRRAVMWMIIRRTLVLGGLGVAIGTLGALWAARLLATFLFEIEPTDPATFGAVALMILLAALAAGFIPARRATRVDPLVALRHE
jgi:putative ABC transport system permease protein